MARRTARTPARETCVKRGSDYSGGPRKFRRDPLKSHERIITVLMSLNAACIRGDVKKIPTGGITLLTQAVASGITYIHAVTGRKITRKMGVRVPSGPFAKKGR